MNIFVINGHMFGKYPYEDKESKKLGGLSLLNLFAFSLEVPQSFHHCSPAPAASTEPESGFVSCYMFSFTFSFHRMVCMLILMVISSTFRPVLDLF